MTESAGPADDGDGLDAPRDEPHRTGAAPARASARHAGRWRGVDPLALLLVVLSLGWIALVVGSPLTAKTTFQPDTILSTFAPWKAVAPNDIAVTQYCNADNVDGIQPGRALAVHALDRGEVATLDPYQVGGSPSVLSLDTGVFDPVTFVPFTTLPLRVAPAYEKVLELLVVLLGMVLWVRRLGMSTAAGVVGGFVFGLSGFMVTWTNWTQTSVACWIPMLFWAGERLAQRRSLSSGLLVSVPLASMILGGFPAVTGWALYAWVVYVALRLLLQRRPFRALLTGGAAAAVGGAFAVGISSFLLLPFVSAYHDHGFSYRDDLGTAVLNKQALATTLFPNAFGGCGFLRGHSWVLARGYVESDMFVGTAALVLCVVALTGRLRPGMPRGPRLFAVLLAVFLANQMVERNALGRFVSTLPVFASSPPGRLRAVFAISFALLAAMGVDRIVARSWQPRWWRRWQTVPVAAVWVVVAGVTAYVARQTRIIQQQNKITELLPGVERALLVAALTAAVVLAAARWRRLRAPAVLGVALIVGIQGAAFARGFFPRDPPSTYYPVTPAQAYLDSHLGTYRAVGDGSAQRPGTSTQYESRSPVGHAYLQSSWNDLLQAVDSKSDVTRTFTALAFDDNTIRNPILDQLSIRYVLGVEDNLLLGTTTPEAGDGQVALAAGRPVVGSAGSTPLRGVGVTLAAPLSVAGAPFAAVHVDVLDRTGREVSSGTRRLYAGLQQGAVLEVGVTDPGTAAGPFTARVSLQDAPGAVTAVSASGGAAALTLTTRPDDGLRLVSADGSLLYERTGALPHVRWASTVLMPAPAMQLATLSAGIGTNSVVLPAGAPGLGSGAPATVAVRTDDDTEVAAQVDAKGSGYLVVSDADLQDWSATVDGRAAPIVAADHGLQAVPVPAGSHRVVLEYRQAGLQTGIAVTVGSLILYVVAWALVAVRRRSGRRRGPDRGSGSSPDTAS